MKNRRLTIILIGIILCCSASLGAMFAIFGAGFLSGAELPVYEYKQVSSAHEGYLRTTLTSGNTVYVMDYEEYALVSANSAPTEMIGRFPVTIGNSGLYAIPGQDPSAYVLEFDPMYQQVYRNINHPPFDWRTAEFKKLRLMFSDPVNPKESGDSRLIAEILSSLKSGNPTIVPMQTDGNYSNAKNHTILLFSDELPGMMYIVGVHVTDAGEVYLAENPISNQWMSAGLMFTAFVNDK